MWWRPIFHSFIFFTNTQSCIKCLLLHASITLSSVQFAMQLSSLLLYDLSSACIQHSYIACIERQRSLRSYFPWMSEKHHKFGEVSLNRHFSYRMNSAHFKKIKRKKNPQNSKYFADPRPGWAGGQARGTSEKGVGHYNLISRRIHWIYWKKNNNKFHSTSCPSKWASSLVHKLVLTTLKATD